MLVGASQSFNFFLTKNMGFFKNNRDLVKILHGILH